MKTYFSSPDEVHIDLPHSLIQAVVFVESKLQTHEFSFKPPYQVARYGGQIVELLKQSGWSLSITPESWEIKPLIG